MKRPVPLCTLHHVGLFILALRYLVGAPSFFKADFFEEFKGILEGEGCKSVRNFIVENSDEKAIDVLETYLARPTHVKLYDGVSNPYNEEKAKWYFLAWLMRDAPAQRLAPLLNEVQGKSLLERKARFVYVYPNIVTSESRSDKCSSSAA